MLVMTLLLWASAIVHPIVSHSPSRLSPPPSLKQELELQLELTLAQQPDVSAAPSMVKTTPRVSLYTIRV